MTPFLLTSWSVALAQHVLQPPQLIGGPGSATPSLAVDAEGDVMVGWSAYDRVTFRASVDGGVSFGPEQDLARVPADPWSDLMFRPTDFQPMAVAAGAHFVLSGLQGSSSWFPPFGLPPMRTIDVVALYSDLAGGQWLDTQVARVSDVCATPELGCSWVRGFGRADLDVDDDADLRQFAFATWDLQPSAREGEIWVRSSTAAGTVSTPVNLSRLLARDGNEYDPALTTDAIGERVFVTFLSQGPVSWEDVLFASSDGGATWTMRSSVSGGYYGPDVDYARDAEVLVWGYLSGVSVRVRTSADDGVTFGPEVELARRHNVVGGFRTVDAPVKVAVSRDGATIAVLHQEEDCPSATGCSNRGDLIVDLSEDGGATFVRSTVAAGIQVNPYAFYDVGVSDSGDIVTLAWSDSAGVQLTRALR